MLFGVLLFMVSRHFPALPLRPNHALGLESIYTNYAGLDYICGRHDADFIGIFVPLIEF